MERMLGTDHPDTLASRANLALAYHEAGRTAEAFELFEQGSLAPAPTLPWPNRRRAGPPRRSRYTSAPSPTWNGSLAPTILAQQSRKNLANAWAGPG